MPTPLSHRTNADAGTATGNWQDAQAAGSVAIPAANQYYKHLVSASSAGVSTVVVEWSALAAGGTFWRLHDPLALNISSGSIYVEGPYPNLRVTVTGANVILGLIQSDSSPDAAR